MWHADRGRLLIRTPGPVPLGLEYVLLVETNPFPNLSLFYRTMLFEYPSVLSRFCSIFKVFKNYSLSKSGGILKLESSFLIFVMFRQTLLNILLKLYSSRAPGLTSGLQGSVNVHRGALLLVPQ